MAGPYDKRLDDRLTLRLPTSVRQQLRAASDEFGQTPSEFLRWLIIDYFRTMALPVIRETRLGPRIEER